MIKLSNAQIAVGLKLLGCSPGVFEDNRIEPEALFAKQHDERWLIQLLPAICDSKDLVKQIARIAWYRIHSRPTQIEPSTKEGFFSLGFEGKSKEVVVHDRGIEQAVATKKDLEDLHWNLQRSKNDIYFSANCASMQAVQASRTAKSDKDFRQIDWLKRQAQILEREREDRLFDVSMSLASTNRNLYMANWNLDSQNTKKRFALAYKALCALPGVQGLPDKQRTLSEIIWMIQWGLTLGTEGQAWYSAGKRDRCDQRALEPWTKQLNDMLYLDIGFAALSAKLSKALSENGYVDKAGTFIMFGSYPMKVMNLHDSGRYNLHSLEINGDRLVDHPSLLITLEEVNKCKIISESDAIAAVKQRTRPKSSRSSYRMPRETILSKRRWRLY